ncbi:hypothetical protein HRG_014597 [Hirsutella rhossiliensis]
MENDTPQAVRNCRTCKQDLPEVEFRSVKDPTKFTTECANSVAAMQKIASKPLPRRASKRTDSLANLTPPRRTAPTPASANALQPPSMPDLFRGLVPAPTGMLRAPQGPSTPSAARRFTLRAGYSAVKPLALAT